jgi:hypothetical protein
MTHADFFRRNENKIQLMRSNFEVFSYRNRFSLSNYIYREIIHKKQQRSAGRGIDDLIKSKLLQLWTLNESLQFTGNLPCRLVLLLSDRRGFD